MFFSDTMRRNLLILCCCQALVMSAGTPPADIIYALAFSRVLFKFNDAMDAQGLRSSLCSHAGPPLQLVDVDYCDDAVVPVDHCLLLTFEP